MRRRAWVVGLVAACCGVGWGGTVKTRDGTVHEGDVRLVAGGLRVGGVSVVDDDVVEAQVSETGIVDASWPGAWKAADVGKPRHAGKTTWKDGAFSIEAGGWGFWAHEDSGHFVHQEIEGDFQIIARVTATGELKANAGVMVRRSLDARSALVAVLVHHRQSTFAFARPPKGLSWYDRAEGTPEYRWVRIARSGNEYTTYRSADGVAWEGIETRAVEGMEGRVLVGLCAGTLMNAYTSVATIDSVRIAKGRPFLTFFADATLPARGVLLVDGTALAGEVGRVTEQTVILKRDGKDIELPAERVARLLYNPGPGRIDAIFAGKTGVLLAGGDFLEGEMAVPFEGRYFNLRSLIFGQRQFDGPHQVVAAGLREVKADPGLWVRAKDGSVYRGKVELKDGAVTIEHPLIGKVELPAGEVVSIGR